MLARRPTSRILAAARKLGYRPIEALAELQSDGIPIVDLDVSGFWLHLTWQASSQRNPEKSLTWDREQGFRIGVEHLVELGHTSIAILRSVAQGARTTGVKLAGYKLGLQDAGIGYDEALVQDVPGDSFEHGYEGFKKLIERRPDVTAVMCMDDPVAVGVIAAARDLGLETPANISVTGYGARTGWRLVPPKLTTIAARATPVVEKVVDYMMAMREEHDIGAEPVSEPMVLIL